MDFGAELLEASFGFRLARDGDAARFVDGIISLTVLAVPALRDVAWTSVSDIRSLGRSVSGVITGCDLSQGIFMAAIGADCGTSASVARFTTSDVRVG